MVIDRIARDKAARLLRRFFAGNLTNFQLIARWPKSEDAAIHAIESTVWCFYDDFQEHRMRGTWKISRQDRRTCARWILFLYSSNEYGWPEISFPGIRPLKFGWLSKIIGVARLRQKYESDFMSSGNYSCWPFIDEVSLDRCRDAPRLLANPLPEESPSEK